MKKEYSEMSQYYDMLHNEKDYKSECEYFSEILFKNKQSKDSKLLDLACGTGEHIKFLKKNFVCEGLDISQEMIAIAKNKNPEIKFYIDDMISFKLDKKYDIITILFNSIAYLNKRDLKKAIKNAYNHLNKNGVFLVETAFIKDKFNVKENRRTYQDDNLKIIREIGIKYGKDSVILNAKYKINSSEFIENDEQKIPLFKENYLQELFLSENFKVKTYHYKHNKSTLFLGLK